MKKRPDGRYSKQIYLGKDENGKRQYKTVYGNTIKEVNTKVDETKASLGRGLDASELNARLTKWSKLYLAAEKTKLTSSAYKTKEFRLSQFTDSLGDIKLADIRPYMVNQFLADLSQKNPSTGKPSTAKTLKEYKIVISQMFHFAKQNGAITTNPAEDAVIPKQAAPKKERRALTEEEQKWIQEIPDYVYPAKQCALIAMWAGLRRGEIAALTWDDVDFKNNVIKVNKSYDYKANAVKGTKTASGERIVPLIPPLKEALSKCKKSHSKCKLVSGSHIDAYQWDKMLVQLFERIEESHGNKDADAVKTQLVDKYVLKVSVPTWSWHELRHTYATILYDNDIPVKVAQVWLGHADSSTTMNIYTHLSKQKNDSAIETIMQYASQMQVN